VGGTSDAALNRAARWADGLLTENMSTRKVMAIYLDRYGEIAKAAGRGAGSIVVHRNGYLSTSDSDIEETFIPKVLMEQLGYRGRGAAENVEDENNFYARAAGGETIGLAEISDGRTITGNPEQVIGQIKAWEQATGITHINLMGMGPEQSPEQRRKTLELWEKKSYPI
jgi:alkanesulfonate monooxygenase SsuD/methylene tetrahydromethanopterin reductase-like flavin-dependent oxidoreductase (luciferase family)